MADFSKLTNKFDLKEIVNNVKSIINPNSKIPNEIESDPLGQKTIEIMKCLEVLKGNLEAMTEELTKLDNAIGNLNQQIVAAKKIQLDKTTGPASKTTATKIISD